MYFEFLDPEPKNLCERGVLCCSGDPCWPRLEITTTLSTAVLLGGGARKVRSWDLEIRGEKPGFYKT